MLDDESRIAALPVAPPALLRDRPTTERGTRTRAALVAAARKVFERSGYLDARLIDIAKEAGCATGSFYTYFANKEEVFAAVLEVARDDMMHPGMGRVAGADDPYAVLEASNRAYLAAYQRNAKLMGSWSRLLTSTRSSGSSAASVPMRSYAVMPAGLQICSPAASRTRRWIR